MHIMLMADGRSPITRRWIRSLKEVGHELTLVSSFPCTPVEGIERFFVLPVAFSGLAGSQVSGAKARDIAEGKAGTATGNLLKQMVRRYRSILQSGRAFLGPFTLPFYENAIGDLVSQHQPDLVHALRVPYEGMLASFTPPEVPMVASIWGNDLTLHAPSSPLMGHFTRRTLNRADGLITDVYRDIRLSRQWGFREHCPILVALTSGGIDLTEMERVKSQTDEAINAMLPVDVPLVVNPRGLRPGYVRNDIFFRAIPLLLERWTNVCFVCPSMHGQYEAEKWVRQLRIEEHVKLLPYLSQTQLWSIFRRSQVSVSLTTHDGTPNTLLEAMALGCFPVVGDIESLREWIVPGVNGLLIESDNPQALADALLLALRRDELRSTAAQVNHHLVHERAELRMLQSQLNLFYRRVIVGSNK
jgi:glycosyltransferase involved in cell wall biosynthesis